MLAGDDFHGLGLSLVGNLLRAKRKCRRVAISVSSAWQTSLITLTSSLMSGATAQAGASWLKERFVTEVLLDGILLVEVKLWFCQSLVLPSNGNRWKRIKAGIAEGGETSP